MRSRPLALTAVSAALLASLAVTTAARAACHPLLTDKAGDATVASAGPNVAALDVRTLDVATGKNEVVVMLGLAAPPDSADSYVMLGRSWTVSFKVGGTQVSVTRGRQAGTTATPTAGGTVGGTPLAVTASVNGSSIIWRFKRAQLAMLKKGALLTGFFVSVTSPVAHDYAPDSATASNVTYKDRAASCAKAA